MFFVWNVGLSRDYEEAQQKLVDGNGLDILIKSLRSNVEKLQIKSCFLCSSICNNPLIKCKRKNLKFYKVNQLIIFFKLNSSVNK